jgi:hypothetical protein
MGEIGSRKSNMTKTDPLRDSDKGHEEWREGLLVPFNFNVRRSGHWSRAIITNNGGHVAIAF